MLKTKNKFLMGHFDLLMEKLKKIPKCIKQIFYLFVSGGWADERAALGAGPTPGGQNQEPQHGPVQLPARLSHHPHDRPPHKHPVAALAPPPSAPYRSACTELCCANHDSDFKYFSKLITWNFLNHVHDLAPYDALFWKFAFEVLCRWSLSGLFFSSC